MKAGDFNKAGWHWTRKGWKRTPKRLQTVKKVAKRRPHKKVPVKPADGTNPPTHAEAKNLLAEHGKGVSAPTPAPDSTAPAVRQYQELDEVTKRLSRPAERRRSVNPPWIKPKPTTTTPPPKRAWSGKYADLTKPEAEPTPKGEA